MIKKNFTIDYILAPKRDHHSTSATTVSTNSNNNNNNNINNNNNNNININNNTNDVITNTKHNSGGTVVQLNVVVNPFNIDGDSGECDGDGDGEGDSECNAISRLSLYSASPSSSADKNQQKEKEKGPFCAKCKLHSEYFLVKNHKDQCKRRFCNCDVCKLIDEGKTLRGKKRKRDSSLDSRSNRSNRRVSPEDGITLAGKFKSDLKCFISQEPGPEGRRMEKLLNSVLYLLLQRNRFDANTLKKKFLAVARAIEEKRRGRNCNILGGINSFHGESSEVVGPSSPTLTERLNLDRPRHLSSSSATTFSPQSLTCLSTSPNTIIIPTNLPTPLLSSSTVTGSITSPSGIPGGTGTSLTFAPTPLNATSKSTGATNTSSSSSSSASSSISSTSSSTSITSAPVSSSVSASAAAAAAAACSSILSLTGTEYSVSSVTAIPQPTIFSSSLFCPTYPYSPLVTSGPLQSPYQTTINCPTGIIRSPPSVSPGKGPFSPHHPGSTRSSPNSCANFNRTNHNVSIHLAESIHKSTNHHNHQHTTSLYSFLGSNSGAINLSKRLN